MEIKINLSVNQDGVSNIGICQQEPKSYYTPFTKDNCPDGVFILSESKKLWEPQFWGLSKDKAHSVAFLKGKKKLLIALKGSDSGLTLLPDGVKVDLKERSDIDEALKDSSGKENTSKLCKAESEAAKFCRNLGEEWYLPTLSEMSSLYKEGGAIDAALFIAKGDPLYRGWHWTSTRYSGRCNCVFGWDDGGRFSNCQDCNYRVRPVSAF